MFQVLPHLRWWAFDSLWHVMLEQRQSGNGGELRPLLEQRTFNLSMELMGIICDASRQRNAAPIWLTLQISLVPVIGH